MTLSLMAEDVSSEPVGENLTACAWPFNIEVVRERIRSNDPVKLTLPVGEELALLDQLAAFDLGRSLLQNRALSGYWTAYLIVYATRLGRDQLSPLEQWVIYDCPVVKATRERFYIFRDIIQKYVAPGKVLASIPCGCMEDLLGLDFKDAAGVTLVGLDIDQQSIDLAARNAKERGFPSKNVYFEKCDAWSLVHKGKFDLLTSNGLNIYVPDNAKVVELYQQFFGALKPGGVLVTSFLTPPPALSPHSPWQVQDPEALKKQKAIFADIIQASWQTFRTEDQTRKQLEEVGFIDVEFTYDSQKMFPTVVARKASSTGGGASVSQ